MDVRAPDGSIARFPDGMSDEAITAVMRKSYPPQQAQAPQRPIIAATAEDYAAQAQPQKPQLGEPSVSDYLRTNPVIGAPSQTLLRAGQGIEQLGAHGLGMIPGLGGIPKAVDESIDRQNQGYEQAKRRVLQAAPDPRLTNAFIGTGETMGNLINPAGMAGNAVRATGTVGNAALRGALSGAGYGASQPVLGDQSNFGGQKAGQVATGAAIGAGTGALAEKLGPKPAKPHLMTTDELESAGSKEFQKFSKTPVPVSPEFADAISGRYGKQAINDAISGAESRRNYTLVNELKSLLDDDPTKLPQQISAEAADKISRAFREGAAKAMKADEATVGSGLFGRRNDVEAALSNVPGVADARQLWRQFEKSKVIDEAIQTAKDLTRTPGGTGGLDQSLRVEFGKIIRDRDLFATFSPEEQQAIIKVRNGDFPANLLQRLGKMSPAKNHLSAMVELAAAIGGGAAAGGVGVIPAAAFAGTGLVANAGANRATGRNAALVSELIRGGKPSFAPQAGPSPNVPIGNAATALLSQLLLQPRGQ